MSNIISRTKLLKALGNKPYIYDDYTAGLASRWETDNNIIKSFPAEDCLKDSWVKCSEKLPEESGCYLVLLRYDNFTDFTICNWIDGQWWERELLDKMVAWVPLKEPVAIIED